MGAPTEASQTFAIRGRALAKREDLKLLGLMGERQGHGFSQEHHRSGQGHRKTSPRRRMRVGMGFRHSLPKNILDDPIA